jgi:hypothetical protein
MEIRAANGRTQNANQNIKLTDSGQRDFLQPKARGTLLFDQRLHLRHGHK